MTGRAEGKVALITGAARGQGRAHAVRLAEEGADIVAFDICGPITGRENVPAATPEDLAETAREVEALDRRIVTVQGDTRDLADLERAVDAGLSHFGHIDIAVANAGVAGGMSRAHEISEDDWRTTLGVNLTGVWHTAKAVLPTMIEARAGSIVIISSGAGVKAMLHLADYASTKAAVIMLARVLALEYAQYGIRVNTICPGNVETPLVINDFAFKLFRPDLPNPSREDVEPIIAAMSPLKTTSGWLDPREIANAVLWLSSDEAAYVSGITLPVDQAFLAG
jgi:(+)-trans-carveol dehydrogenase